MEKEKRQICFDETLLIEAYQFEGILQPFPNHFHEHYVLGLIEKGKRRLTCKKVEFSVSSGDLLLFSPFDNHACVGEESDRLTYRCLNVSSNKMKTLVEEFTGESYLPVFKSPVVKKSELSSSLKELHKRILQGEQDFKKEELFYFFMEQLLKEHMMRQSNQEGEKGSKEMNRIAQYLASHYDKTITLDELSQFSGMSKYHLLRTFTMEKGISPYRYLENIRIYEAKKRLEQGETVMDTALQTGFSDQSHFTNFFKKLIGLTPKQYQNIFREFK